ncbi:Glycosyl transferase family 13 [Trinorchestia longiramus]|nr:Glycosyl transferase family 13 [Trinorchestia longiramus]
MKIHALAVTITLCVMLTRITQSSDAYPGQNVMYTPKDIHFISLQSIDDVTGKTMFKNFTVNDASLAYLNTTVEELEQGHLHKTKKGKLVLELASGQNLTISVEQRTVVKLVDKFGKSDLEVDLYGFQQLSMDDLRNDSSLIPAPAPALQWPEPDWRPLRSVTVLVNSSTVTVVINRNNLVFNMTTNIIHPGMVWQRPHGIVMIAVHPMTCRVTFSNVFPTAEFGGYRDLMDSLQRVSPGRVIVIAGLHDGSLQLLEARRFLQEALGSFVSDQYLFRDSWAWVFIKSGQTLGEAYSPNLPRDFNHVHPHNVTFEELINKENINYARDVDVLRQSLSNASSFLQETSEDINKITTKMKPVHHNKLFPGGSREKLMAESASTLETTSSGIHSYSTEGPHRFYEPRQSPKIHEIDYDQGDFEYDTMVWNSRYFKSVNKTINKTASPLFLDARIPVHEDPIYLLMEYDDCKLWKGESSINDRWEARIKFCQTYDGYASLCDCKNPFFLKKNRGALTNPYDVDIPILVLTANRTRLLFRVLEALGAQPGVHEDLITVVMDGWHEEAARLAHVLNFRLLIHRPEGNSSILVSRNLRFGLYHMLQLYSDAQQFIVLEDDLILSPDFYRYMQHTSPIFAMDETVYCVSAFNHLSYPHTSLDPAQLYRVESFPAYGWMVPRSEVTYILPRWFPANVVSNYRADVVSTCTHFLY